ncbi:hypothetical protein [Streptomyces sp. NPDC058272]|uniref:hypothetical protein n=1 Tax=Streptomyces sp. NPDC058272 TaxID=3346415 RepID=UPI0036EFF35B
MNSTGIPEKSPLTGTSQQDEFSAELLRTVRSGESIWLFTHSTEREIMKMRRSFAAVVVSSTIAVIGSAGAGAAFASPAPAHSADPSAHSADPSAHSADPSAHSADPSTPTATDLSQLLEKATAPVKAEYPKADLMLAEGEAPGGPTSKMADVTDWRFVFNTNADQPRAKKSVEISGNLDGAVGRMKGNATPWAGVMPISTQKLMSPSDAYNVLKTDQAYQYVSLVKPLNADPHLQYHFSKTRGGCDGFAVNTDDGSVNPIC